MANGVTEQSWTHQALGFLKTTMVGGLVFMAPLIVLIFLVVKASEVLRRLAKPLAAHLPIDTIGGLVVADVLLIVLLIVACFSAGLLARFSFANRFVKKAEAGVLWRIPGYGFIKGLTDSLDKSPSACSMRTVLIHFDDSAQLAFEVDHLPDGRKVIYIPSSPDPRAGSVMVMDADRVEPVPISFATAVRLLRALGRGMGSSVSAGRGATTLT
jgi:uncharacterized membrane protein